VRYRLLSLALLSAVALVPTAHGARPQTTVPNVFVTVHITITDSRIKLDRHSAGRGDQVRFAMRNAGTRVHSFTLGTPVKPGTARQSGFSTKLRPNEEKALLLFLDYRGPLPYRSILKYDVSKPGMRGIFKIL
jgi:hypothetical protein